MPGDCPGECSEDCLENVWGNAQENAPENVRGTARGMFSDSLRLGPHLGPTCFTPRARLFQWGTLAKQTGAQDEADGAPDQTCGDFDEIILL